jgi:acyl carrier protein
MLQLLLLAGFIVVFVGLVWLDSASQVRAAERHMAGREPLSPEQFGATLFPAGQAAIAARLRELLAEETVIDLGRLRPQDRPVADLRIDALDSLALSEYILAIESSYGIKLEDAEIATIRSFGELVELVSRRVSAPGTA